MVHLLYHRTQLDDVFFDDKLIGVYSSYEKAQSTITKYSELPGFSDFPSDFCIESFNVSKNTKHLKNKVYILIEMDIVQDEELTGSYALYASRIKAIAAMLLKIICGNLCIRKKFYIDRYFIDVDNWCEGFVIIPPQ